MMRLTLNIVATTLFGTEVESDAREVGECLEVILDYSNGNAFAMMEGTLLLAIIAQRFALEEVFQEHIGSHSHHYHSA